MKLPIEITSVVEMGTIIVVKWEDGKYQGGFHLAFSRDVEDAPFGNGWMGLGLMHNLFEISDSGGGHCDLYAWYREANL